MPNYLAMGAMQGIEQTGSLLTKILTGALMNRAVGQLMPAQGISQIPRPELFAEMPVAQPYSALPGRVQAPFGGQTQFGNMMGPSPQIPSQTPISQPMGIQPTSSIPSRFGSMYRR